MKYRVIFLQILSINAQKDKISGCVYNEFKEQLPNAHVTLLEQKKTFVTDTKGCFQFSLVSSSNYTLKIQYIGYKPFYKKIVKGSKN